MTPALAVYYVSLTTSTIFFATESGLGSFMQDLILNSYVAGSSGRM